MGVMQPHDGEELSDASSGIYWVAVSVRHGRIFAEVLGTGLTVSARSIAVLRRRLTDAIEAQATNAGQPFRIYWRHDGRDVLVVGENAGPAGGQG